MRKLTTLVAAVAVLIGLSACGDDDDSPSLGAETATSAEDDTSMAMEDDASMEMEDDHESFSFGEPGDEADATRTVDVRMDDDFTYDPDGIDVSAGETVTFQITNDGEVVHEFVIGDDALQAEHEEEMAGMEAGMMMGDEPNAVAVEPGDTKTLTFTFSEAAELEYACHQPGHYDAGMHSPLTVS